MTSHDVVARVRRVLGGAKVGHAGTLDPEATGVLVLCLGRATKISAFLMEGEKTYVGRGRLGVVTDTQDATGRVLSESPVNATPEDVRALAPRFTGRIEQVPPMFSAVKIEGRKLYRLARQGLEVERAARPVTVHAFEILDVSLPDFDFALRCSKGTYVRTLVHDLGAALGCGAHLVQLSREAQGGFQRADALPYAALEGEGAAAAVRAAKVGIDVALGFLAPCEVPAGPALRVGALVRAPEAEVSPEALVRLVDAGQRLLGIGRVVEAGIRVLHVFPAPAPAFGRGRRGP